jgi:hypothetical protein
MLRRSLIALLATTVLVATPSFAAVAERAPSRFDRLVILDPATQLGTVAEAPEALPDFESERAGWSAFKQESGGSWSVHVDRRTGVPLFVQGSGLRLFPADGAAPSRAAVETLVREFVTAHETLFKIRNAEMVLSSEGSGPVDKDHWVLLFTRRVGGLPVDGERFLVDVIRGNLVSFGADRWGAISSLPLKAYDAAAARRVLMSYMSITATDRVEWLDDGTELLGAEPSVASADRRYLGAVGDGIRYHLAYRMALRVAGEPGVWVGQVDATTGRVLSFVDDVRYDQVKGGVFPASNDGQCTDGCEQPNWPMPHADVTINGTLQNGDALGAFNCSPAGLPAVTTLAGPYVKVQDSCGPISESVTCGDDLDLRSSDGTDCQVPAGASAGNTHSSRTGFYHLNRDAERARHWLPSNTWLQSQLVDNVNLSQTCNAYWNGVSVNFFLSGGGCRNTGEIAGVFLHEYGHGLDANDGGGYDDPSETYADANAIIALHASCIGRGFHMTGNCDGYGDACLNCTGIREQDWNQHASHTPATPANFASSHCGAGDSPCGKEQHCETHIGAEAIYDLATRDLPATGMDQATAWQLVEKLWYESRQGSGGNAYNCTLPLSDGCGTNSWFAKIRNVDDDDGNLANGTPHAAAIFAAFNRHAIACGLATDASNQSTSSCPAIAAPTLTATAGAASVGLGWTAVPNASSYLVLRNEAGCGSGSLVVATVAAPTTTYTDTPVPSDFPLYYTVEAEGVNAACDGPVSACQSATVQSFAGSISLGQAAYSCSSTIQITVKDGNVGSDTTSATIASTTEPAGETVVLTATAPGSGRYLGTIPADAGPPTSGNGRLSIANGDVITATYVDADDGAGGHNVTRQATATADCIAPAIGSVSATGIDDTHATISWTTSEATNAAVHYDTVRPPAQTATQPALSTSHAVGLSGLHACTTYWYSAESQDPAGNDVVDANAGQYFHFETLVNLGAGLQSCHAGKVTLAKAAVGCTDTLTITVQDVDPNVSPSIADIVQVTVTSTTEISPETVTLIETGPNTSIFTGSIPIVPGAAVPDGKLQVADGDTVAVNYRDADDGTGTAANSEAFATADCTGPGSTVVEDIGNADDSAVIHWVTTEPTSGRLDWGPTASLGNTFTYFSLATDHSVTISPLNECSPYFFRVTATDAQGNTSVFDNHGVPYQMQSWRIPPGLFKDEFETSTGWTLTGDWEIGSPQGKGSPPPDPTSAFDGTKVLGQDLSGLGAHPGDYEPGTVFTATSPSINATSLVNGQLRFRRWLTTGDGGVASILVIRNGITQSVWSTTLSDDASWNPETISLSPFSDGAASLKIQFKQQAGPVVTHCGWNIDRVIVNSANQPDFEACGGCGQAPSFAGLLSARDANPCGDTGVALSWSAAAAWGSGSPGTYIVYRSTTPNFVPSSANMIAHGVAATSYTDASAPNGVTLYYLVRAENGETCSAGPNNHGVVDANTVYLSARDDLTQPAPGAVGSTLLASGINSSLVRLTWAAAPSAASYHVYRSATPAGGFSQIGTTTGLLFEDRDQFNSADSWYYVVKAADACGNEGP